MKASTLIKKIQNAINEYGDLHIKINENHIDKLLIKKIGPYSEHSSKRSAGKTFMELSAEENPYG
jgi:hypothetical protein